MALFRRKYRLTLGNKNDPDFVQIEELEMNFTIRFSSDNKKKADDATFDVVNLGQETLNKINREFAVLSFEVGYADDDTDLVNLFTGEVISVSTRKTGTDRVTSITASPAALSLSFGNVNKVVPEGRSVSDAIEEIRKAGGYDKGEYKGTRVFQKIPFGYPLSGTPRQMLDEVCSTYMLEWRIQGNALFVNDEEVGIKGGGSLVPLITSESGLLEIPYYQTENSGKSKKNKTKLRSLMFDSLLNTEITCGNYVKIQHDDIDGLFKVNELTFTGGFRSGDWKCSGKCTAAKEA